MSNPWPGWQNPAEAHSSGWVLQQGEVGDDPRTVPDATAPPPTREECKRFGAGLERVRRFYDEGEDKNLYSMEQIDQAKRAYGTARIRLEAQMRALEKYSEANATRKRLLQQFGEEHAMISEEMDKLEKRKHEFDIQNKKREEITRTMEYLQFLFDRHCSQFGDYKES